MDGEADMLSHVAPLVDANSPWSRLEKIRERTRDDQFPHDYTEVEGSDVLLHRLPPTCTAGKLEKLT
jgi:hypothetical protein